MKNGKDIWMQASGSVTQRIKQDDVGQVIHIDKIDGSNGVLLDPKTGSFTVESDGDYLVVAAPQVGRENPGDNANFRCWLRVNGENVPDSNVLLNLFHVDLKDVIVSQGLVHLNAGDVIQVLMATNNAAAGVGVEAIQPTPDEPLVPSIIFSIEAYG
ncbi:hypothetical protein [Paraglaciecola sp. MB-3u-78]|jgi:hypothetical protein|uniref:hypothetical protein n=1 Tax=Paraglaciecola sp. MB-3u-78 TaxID=2058332 RepID=UPI000C3345B3|nr:hypothetical protein [Paraglaciecola sp. MB-3u-78]PKG99379.1 hypothetical protein CXF95_09020 [Paraglaciecola sp. MB-3u-78]